MSRAAYLLQIILALDLSLHIPTSYKRVAYQLRGQLYLGVVYIESLGKSKSSLIK